MQTFEATKAKEQQTTPTKVGNKQHGKKKTGMATLQRKMSNGTSGVLFKHFGPEHRSTDIMISWNGCIRADFETKT